MNHQQKTFKPQTAQSSAERHTVNLLSSWSEDGKIAAARMAVEQDISAVELTQTINKFRAR